MAVDRRHDDFDLQTFFPYLVRIFYRAVSGSISDIYLSETGLGPPEWRIMVVLGPYRSMSAGEIVDNSSMDKVTVSRAIKKLTTAGLIRRDIDGNDRRRVALKLTQEGIEMWDLLIPLVKEREQQLLDGLSSEERRQLVELMAKVRTNAGRFSEQ